MIIVVDLQLIYLVFRIITPGTAKCEREFGKANTTFCKTYTRQVSKGEKVC